jgi:S1-C subfamily serine protease
LPIWQLPGREKTVKAVFLVGSVCFALWLAGCTVERKDAKLDEPVGTTSNSSQAGKVGCVPPNSTNFGNSDGTAQGNATATEVPSSEVIGTQSDPKRTRARASLDVQAGHKVQERPTVRALEAGATRPTEQLGREREKSASSPYAGPPLAAPMTPVTSIPSGAATQLNSFVPDANAGYMPKSAVPVAGSANGLSKKSSVGDSATAEDGPSGALITPSEEAGLLSPEDIFEHAAPAVVKIVLYDATGTTRGLGSGFFLGGGRVITNAHVVSHAYSGEVQSRARTYRSVTILKEDTDLDLALLGVEDAGEPLLSMSNSTSLRPGQRVIAIGNPLGLDRTMSDGLISAVRTLPGGVQLLQISAPVSPGSSGGPLLDLNGSVIGVTSASMSDGQNLNFAVSVQTVRRFLAQEDSPQQLREAGTRVLWKVALKRLGQVLLFLIALAFGGGWFFIIIAVMILGLLFALLKGLFTKVFHLFHKPRTLRRKSEAGASSYDPVLSPVGQHLRQPYVARGFHESADHVSPERRPHSVGGLLPSLIKGIGGAICAILILGILVTNTLAGVVAAIWLLFLHEWRIVLGGFFLSLTMPYWWLLAALPGMGLGLIAAVLFERKWWPIGLIPGVLGLLWNAAALIAWVTGVFLLCLRHSPESGLIPMLLWGYAIAVSPVAYMASHEPADAVASHMGVLMVEVAYVVLVVVGVLLDHPSLSLGIVLCVGAVEVLLLTINVVAVKAAHVNTVPW